MSFDLDSYLTPHFKLRELCYTAHRSIDNTPSDEVVYRLITLCETFLEPIRKQFGPVKINSGYRCLKLNKLIGGAKDSAHLYGVAADIDLLNNTKLQKIIDWIVSSDLPYDQIILESSSTSNWVHIGGLRPNHGSKPRKEVLRFKDGKYSTYDKNINYGV